MAESPTSQVLQVTAAGLCIFSRQSQEASGLQAPRDGAFVCCHLPTVTGRAKSSYDQYSLRETTMSQNIYHGCIWRQATAPLDNAIYYIAHIPFTLGSRELLLQSFLIFSFQDAEAQELGSPVHREEAQLRSAAHKAVRVVPVIYHSQLRLFRMHHLLGNPDLALGQIKATQEQLLGRS